MDRQVERDRHKQRANKGSKTYRQMYRNKGCTEIGTRVKGKAREREKVRDCDRKRENINKIKHGNTN